LAANAVSDRTLALLMPSFRAVAAAQSGYRSFAPGHKWIATLAAVTAREQFGFGCRRRYAYREDRGGVRASTSVLSLRSSFVASVHEVLDLFERERAVLIGVHRFKDALVRRLKFLQ
jgi:hypothetical protein